MLDVIEVNKSLLDEAISQTEERGYLVSSKYYEALISQEQDSIKQMEKERTALLDSLNAAISSGAIKTYSEEWYDMCSEVDAVTIAIEEANTALLEYNNSIRQLSWDVFDLILDRISAINTEADFLIDLMSNYDLYDDRGQFTELGVATTGLRAVNYNTLMAEADKYYAEVQSLEKEISKDPYNQDLIDRRDELLELQRESILAAEDEKQAIKDLVEEGIKLEIDSLRELVDQYETAIDEQKSLYDYQKKIAEETSDIATLQKQISAYMGDTSEEGRATRQRLQNELDTAIDTLQESEYDRYVEDQKKLLDQLVDDYETVLNSRLDDLDALISDMIDMVNQSSSEIQTTLKEEAASVGYTLSDSMQSIWSTSTASITDVVTTYGGQIANSLTTLNSTISNINSNVSAMMSSLNKSASSSTNTATSSSSTTNSKATTPTVSSATSTTSTSSSSSSSSSNSGWGSWFIYQKSSYPKDKLNVNKHNMFTLNTLNCGKLPTTPIRYNGTGNGIRECGMSLKLNSSHAG